MKILIISGGSSSERLISLMSAKNVKDALAENGHRVKIFDLQHGYGELRELAKDFDVVFPVIHGEEGEGGELHKFLKDLGTPFVGGDWKAFKNGWYKIPFKKFADKNRIISAKWALFKSEKEIIKFGFPLVLKSTNGGSSREVVIVSDRSDLKRTIVRKLLNSKLELFIERYISGVEVTVAILDDKVLPVIEIVPEKGAWFDYKNKYWGKTQEIPNAPSLDIKTRTKVQQIALRIHKKLMLGHYSRIDFIVKNKKPYVLEVNTIPGLTTSSLFPKAAKAAGISFNKLVDELIDLALNHPI